MKKKREKISRRKKKQKRIDKKGVEDKNDHKINEWLLHRPTLPCKVVNKVTESVYLRIEDVPGSKLGLTTGQSY
jgi:hypothetical protein